jgi:hypothetical protein
MPEARPCPLVPVSWGELLDKITILAIKLERIGDPRARSNVARELSRLGAIAGDVLSDAAVRPIVDRLRATNERLWAIEDAVREHEAVGDFGPDFVALSRSVYRTNDLRAALKRELNAQLDSELIEEKCYAAPARAGAHA